MQLPALSVCMGAAHACKSTCHLQCLVHQGRAASARPGCVCFSAEMYANNAVPVICSGYRSKFVQPELDGVTDHWHV